MRGFDEQVNMIGHEDVRIETTLAFVFCLLHTIEVVKVIIFGEENWLTIVATLNEVM